MSIAVLASADPALVLGQAGELLAGDPVGHNVVGSKLADAVGYGEPGPYWVGLLDGVPAGVAVQQPAGTPLAVAADARGTCRGYRRCRDASDVPLPGVFGRAGTAAPLWDDRHRDVKRAWPRTWRVDAWLGCPGDQPSDGSGGPPDYIGSSLAVLVTFWQLWGRRRLAWVVSTAATDAALPIYGLSIAGMINYVLPGWWMLITGPADVLALATLLSPPIRRSVTMQPAPMG